MAKLFLEVVIAPAIARRGPRRSSAGKKNLRVLVAGGLPDAGAAGADLPLRRRRPCSSRSATPHRPVELRSRPGGRRRTPRRADLEFAFTVAKHVKSNAIVFAKHGATVGIGAGQMSRVDAARIAAWKPRTRGGQPARRAADERRGGRLRRLLPLPRRPAGLRRRGGATAVIQPGGSMRDDDVVRAADDRGMAMLFTGLRHFRH